MDYTTITGHRGTGRAFSHLKYYLDQLCKIETTDVKNFVVFTI